MVDPIGNKASVVALRRIASVAPASETARAAAVNGEAATLVSSAATLASSLAAQRQLPIVSCDCLSKMIRSSGTPACLSHFAITSASTV